MLERHLRGRRDEEDAEAEVSRAHGPASSVEDGRTEMPRGQHDDHAEERRVVSRRLEVYSPEVRPDDLDHHPAPIGQDCVPHLRLGLEPLVVRARPLFEMSRQHVPAG